MMDELPTVELQIDKRKYILLGTFPLALAMIYVLEMPYIASPVWLKWFIDLFLAGTGVWILASVLIGYPYLKLTAYGIESQILFRTLKIRWLDVAIIRAYERKGARFIGFSYV